MRLYLYVISHRTKEDQLADYGAQLDALRDYKKWIEGQVILVNRGEHYRNYNKLLDNTKIKIMDCIEELKYF